MKTKRKVSNVNDLRSEMVLVFNQLRNEEIGISEAKSLANVVGKIMSTVKTEIEHKKMTGTNKRIKFMEYDD